jgi:hypothetical protein
VRAKRPEIYKKKQTINGREVVFEIFVGGEEKAWDDLTRQAEFDRLEQELIEADKALDEAIQRKREARDAWLALVGPDVGAVKDPSLQKRIVTFVNAPKVNKDALYEGIYAQAPDIWSKCVTQETAVTLRFRYDARRSLDHLLRGLNRYASQYSGYVDHESISNDTLVDTDKMTLLCKRRSVRFPEEAFEDQYGVRIYPIDEPFGEQGPG